MDRVRGRRRRGETPFLEGWKKKKKGLAAPRWFPEKPGTSSSGGENAIGCRSVVKDLEEGEGRAEKGTSSKREEAREESS